jgi:hypothetical protein
MGVMVDMGFASGSILKTRCAWPGMVYIFPCDPNSPPKLISVTSQRSIPFNKRNFGTFIFEEHASVLVSAVVLPLDLLFVLPLLFLCDFLLAFGFFVISRDTSIPLLEAQGAFQLDVFKHG